MSDFIAASTARPQPLLKRGAAAEGLRWTAESPPSAPTRRKANPLPTAEQHGAISVLKPAHSRSAAGF